MQICSALQAGPAAQHTICIQLELVLVWGAELEKSVRRSAAEHCNKPPFLRGFATRNLNKCAVARCAGDSKSGCLAAAICEWCATGCLLALLSQAARPAARHALAVQMAVMACRMPGAMAVQTASAAVQCFEARPSGAVWQLPARFGAGASTSHLA